LFFSPTLNQWATMIRRLMDGGNIVSEDAGGL
jgi:hypothetical protein